jgi:CDP-diacylglycerol---serine O-phosphatidyltransferase
MTKTRRRARPRFRVRSVIPSLFTIMNLFCGFIAIKAALVDSNFVAAGWYIVLGGIFDMLDGMMARLVKASSEFGVELDSLCDVVTFGVAPSAILFKAFFYQYPGTGLLLAALPAITGALRLARFNVQLVGFDKDYFRGLPIPSAAILIVSYVTFHHLELPVGERLADTWMFIVSIGASLLMVSTVKYDTIPKPSLRNIKEHPLKFGIYFIGIVAAIWTKGSAIFPLFVIFVLYGVIRSIFERITRLIRERKAAALLDEEELEREEESTFGI